MLRADVLVGAELFETLKEPWRELVADSPDATPFQTFEWHETWWRHFGGLREPQAIAIYEGKDLVSLMPLMRSKGLWRTLRPMGLGPSDYLHPLCRAGYEDAAAEQLVQTMRSARNVDLIDLHQVRENRAMATSFDGTKIEQAMCLLLDLPATFDEYLATIGKSLRYDVRRLEKSFFRTGLAVIEEVDSGGLAQGLDVLFELHKARWRKRGMPGAFFGRSVRFHKEWASRAISNGWLRLSILRFEGKPIGAIYAMALRDTTYYYQAGFDPTNGSISPGTLLVAHTIRRAIEDGCKHFDFMRGDEPYKRRWKPQHVYRNLRLIASANGLLGNLGSSWNQAGSRVEGRVRARLEGRGLIG